MEYKCYYAEFSKLYDEVYAEIVKMMKSKNVRRLEIPYDEDCGGYERITIKNKYYGDAEDFEVAVVELYKDEICIENSEEYSHDVRDVLEGSNITDLYDIVWRALYEK